MNGPPHFTPDQRAAIEAGGPARDTCVVAGPGSGKTTVLVEHFKRMVEGGRRPAAHPGHHLHREGRRQHARETGQPPSATMRKFAPGWNARGSPRCTAFARGCCAKMRFSPASTPEFSVADERQSWRIQQESMASGRGGAFRRTPGSRARARPRALLVRIRAGVLSAYDAMRGAGIRVAELERFPVPPGTGIAQIAATLDALARETVSAWSYSQREHLREILASGARIVWAKGPLEALRAIEEF